MWAFCCHQYFQLQSAACIHSFNQLVEFSACEGMSQSFLRKQKRVPNFIRRARDIYFEHHVHLDEIAPWWGCSMKETVQESLDLFDGLREKGIPAHFWP